MHPAYAESLSDVGAPRVLPRSSGWLLEREIPSSQHMDAMGCYPLFACQNWAGLHDDLENIGNILVSVALVTDPFGEYDEQYLQKCFPDVAKPFKEHFVVDLSQAPSSFVHPHHQRNVRKALRKVSVKVLANPIDFLEDWAALYSTLIGRHKIRGMASFSKESFAKQLRVPGITVFSAQHNDTTVGMLLWYQQGDRAYYHLGAYNSRGYELGASFALFDFAIECFAERGLAWLNLGSGAGVGDGGEQGLTRFKQGWATGVRTAFFCGRILNRDQYRKICENRGLASTPYFPAYRVGEFS